MKKLIAIILALSFPINTFADCKVPVKLIEEGAVAECSGFLFSRSKELEVRLLKQDYDLVTQEISILQKTIGKYKLKESEYEDILSKEIEKSELWRGKAESSTNELIKKEESRTTRDVLFFAGGVALTILSAWAVGQATR